MGKRFSVTLATLGILISLGACNAAGQSDIVVINYKEMGTCLGFADYFQSVGHILTSGTYIVFHLISVGNDAPGAEDFQFDHNNVISTNPDGEVPGKPRPPPEAETETELIPYQTAADVLVRKGTTTTFALLGKRLVFEVFRISAAELDTVQPILSYPGRHVLFVRDPSSTAAHLGKDSTDEPNACSHDTLPPGGDDPKGSRLPVDPHR